MKVTKRLKTLFSLLSILMVVLGGGAVFMGYFFGQAEAERQTATLRPTLTKLDNAERAVRLYAANLQLELANQAFAIARVERRMETTALDVDLQQLTDGIRAEVVGADALANLNTRLETLQADAATFLAALNANVADTASGAPSAQTNTNAEPAATLTDAVASYNNIRTNETNVLAAIEACREAVRANMAASDNAASQGPLVAAGLVGLMVVLAVLSALLFAGVVARAIEKPLGMLLSRMKSRQAIAQEPNELGDVAAYLNRLHGEILQTEIVLNQFGKGAYLDEFPSDNLTERMATSFLDLRSRLKVLDSSMKEREYEAKGMAQNLEGIKGKLRQAEDALRVAVDNHRKTGTYAELDPDGRIVFANPDFQQMLGIGWPEMEGRTLESLLADNNGTTARGLAALAVQGTPVKTILPQRVKDGSARWAALSLSPLRNENGKVTKVAMVAHDVTPLQATVNELRAQMSNLKAEIDTREKQLRATHQQLETTLAQQSALTANVETQRKLEFRLVQQQAALHELARNQSLKDGSVKQALRSVSETVVYALDDERCGIWLFALNGERIRCIDLYERTTMAHTAGFELHVAHVQGFYRAVREPSLMIAEDSFADARTRELSDVYLDGFNVGAILTAPIKLGGIVVGFLMVEHTGKNRNWSLDEQNFLLAIGDLVSLALEQGNRKAMEEELRMTLEESQALEEELRQNAEEIEATNEEMRRTQIELRGQINALNNSAIVSETNLQGFITYANAEFAKVYGHNPRKVVGQSHRILKSNGHSDAFYENLWRTIVQGEVWRGEVKNKSADGSFRWVSLSITPVLGLDGKPYKFIGVSFDITQQKRQEEQVKAALAVALQQEEQLRANSRELVVANDDMRRTQIELAGQINALNNSAMVYETDLDGNIIYVNDRLVSVSGFAEADLMGRHYTVLKSGRQDDRMFHEQWKTVLNGRVWKGEVELRRSTGGIFWAMMTATPVLDENNDPIKSINVMMDVTEQKEQEFRLKKQQAAVLELNQNPAVKEGNTDDACVLITRISQETLGVSRVSIWLNEHNDTKVRCVATSQVGTHPHERGTIIDRALYPAYFRALERDRIVASANPLEDERTKELGFSVLKPVGISAVLDVAIRYGSKTVGVLSIEQKGPRREWHLDEVSFATSLADAVSVALEQKSRQQTDKLKLAYQQLEEANAEMLRQKVELEETANHLKESIKYAKRIQNNILPDKSVLKRELGNYFIVFRPKDIVGGDFYWFSSVDEDRRVIITADGTGHGVPGAFLTLIGYLLMNQIVNEKGHTRPDEILYHLHLGVRQALKQDEEESTSRDGMDVACVTLNMRTLECLYAGANLPLYYYQDWEIHEVRPTKKSIGGEQLEEDRIYELNVVSLKPGDALYMYTDGFVDQLGGPEEKRFSKKRFRDLILRTQHESMKTQRALLNLEWKDWKDDREQLDDVTVFGLKL